MQLDPLEAALVGAIVGALAAGLVQAVRDGQVNRRQLRGVARVVRLEVTTNQAFVATVLGFGFVPEGATPLATERLARGLESLAIELPRDEIAFLLSFETMTREAERRLAFARELGRLSPEHLRWLAETWAPAADFCQVMLDLRGMRAWDRLLSPRMWIAYERRRRRYVRSGGFGAPQMPPELRERIRRDR